MANYLYNGIELPALPEYDKKAYPYVTIDIVNSTTCLNLYAVLPTVNGNQYVFAEKCAVIYYTLHGDTWEYFDSLTISNASFDTLIWSNHDILNEDGTIYLAATIPLPDQLFVQNNESWGYTESGDFNTLPLPNTIDLSVYKYLYLTGYVGADCQLYATDKPLYYKRGSSAFVAGYLGAKEPVNYKYYFYNGSFDVGGTELWLGDWNEPTLKEVSSPNSDGYYVVKSVYPSAQSTINWSNATIYKIDGTVLLEPFEPAPNRSEATTAPIDPTSFMQGYIVGRRLAGMRK